MKKEKAIVLSGGMLDILNAKTCHGLLRGSDRFEVLAVIDHRFAGQDAGVVMDGSPLNIPVFASVNDFFHHHYLQPTYCIVGVAMHGGRLPDSIRLELYDAIDHNLSIVSGQHTFLSDDPEFIERAKQNGVHLIDIRKPRPASELAFWTGEIFSVKTPKIAFLGTDCALGKRTTCRFVLEMCRNNGIKTEMIYTGQTGWMQGVKHGFIFDSTINDFISGEIERVIVECARESKPELILVEGQASLRNPTGPCGSEFLLSGNVKGVILLHAPGRRCFDGTDYPIFSIESEIELIRLYGAEVLAIALNEENREDKEMEDYREELSSKFDLPIIRPLKEGVQSIIPTIEAYMNKEHSRY